MVAFLHAKCWMKSSTIKQVYKFVQFPVYTTESGVKICALSSWSSYTNLYTHASFQSDIHGVVTNCKVLPKFNNACMNLVSVKV